MSAFKKINDGLILLFLLLLISLIIGFISVLSDHPTPIGDFMYSKSTVNQHLLQEQPISLNENCVFFWYCNRTYSQKYRFCLE